MTARRRAASFGFALVAAACGGPSADAPSHPPSQLPSIVEGDAAAIAAWRQQQVGTPLLLNFWATWCAPCVAELPDLLAATRDFRARGGVVGLVAMEHMVDIGRDEALQKVRAKVAELRIDVNVLLCIDEMATVRQALGLDIGGLPQTFAFDRTGAAVAHHEGMASAAEFRDLADLAAR